jgi:aconitate hydratase
VPLIFCDATDHDRIEAGDVLRIGGLHDALRTGEHIPVHNTTREHRLDVRHDLSDRQLDVVLAGGLINDFRRRRSA